MQLAKRLDGIGEYYFSQKSTDLEVTRFLDKAGQKLFTSNLGLNKIISAKKINKL